VKVRSVGELSQAEEAALWIQEVNVAILGSLAVVEPGQ
jgi:hypothetical protein